MEILVALLFGAFNVLAACFIMLVVSRTYMKRLHGKAFSDEEALPHIAIRWTQLLSATASVYYSVSSYPELGFWGLAKSLFVVPGFCICVFLVCALFITASIKLIAYARKLSDDIVDRL